MAGHMGDKYRTMLNLEIIKSDEKNNLIYLRVQFEIKNSTIFLKESIKDVKERLFLEKYNDKLKAEASKGKKK